VHDETGRVESFGLAVSREQGCFTQGSANQGHEAQMGELFREGKTYFLQGFAHAGPGVH